MTHRHALSPAPPTTLQLPADTDATRTLTLTHTDTLTNALSPAVLLSPTHAPALTLPGRKGRALRFDINFI